MFVRHQFAILYTRLRGFDLTEFPSLILYDKRSPRVEKRQLCLRRPAASNERRGHDRVAAQLDTTIILPLTVT